MPEPMLLHRLHDCPGQHSEHGGDEDERTLEAGEHCWSPLSDWRGNSQIGQKDKEPAMKRRRCVPTVLVDDDRVRVTRFDFAPGAETGWHRHAHDYVIAAITDCPMLLEEPGGSTRSVLVAAGTAYRRAEGVEHNVVNAGDQPMSFVEVELK
jgi:quercetin dioxygenase-like cupin family protein